VSVMKKERNKWEIILDILKVTKEERKVKKTRIMQRANLDWRNFKKYFDHLQTDGFITKCNHDPDCYELTEKGKNLLQKLKEVAELTEVTQRFSNQFQYPTRIYPVISQEYPTKIYPAISQKAVF
jgi:predicted transcriptional regulator